MSATMSGQREAYELIYEHAAELAQLIEGRLAEAERLNERLVSARERVAQGPDAGPARSAFEIAWDLNAIEIELRAAAQALRPSRRLAWTPTSGEP